MPPIKDLMLPFLTRDMMRFPDGTTFSLVVQSFSGTANDLTIRGATRNGPFRLRIALNGTYALQTSTFRLPDIPIWITISDDAISQDRGDCYVFVHLAVGDDRMHQLAAGYVFQQRGLSWPMTADVDSNPKRANVRIDTSSNPAAGAEISHTFAAGLTVKILSVRVQLVTDANVANRRVHMVFKRNGITIYEAISSVDQAASLTRNYTFSIFGGLGTYSDDNDILVPIPQDLWLNNTGSIVTETTSIQAGDNFGAASIYVEKSITL